MPGLVVRMNNGDMKWFPLFYSDGKYKFYAPKGEKTGTDVGRDWQFKKYLPGYWTPTQVPTFRRRIGGGSSLVVLDEDGDLRYFPFRDQTFMHRGTGDKVGRGFRDTLDYYVAEWTGNGTSDLLVRDEDGDLRLYPWDGKEFKDLGQKEKVGNGFGRDDVPDLYPGYWTGGTTPDLLIRKKNGDLFVFPFRNRSFYGQDKIKVGDGFKPKDYPHLLVGDWLGNMTPDLLAYRDRRLRLYPYCIVDPKRNELRFTEKPKMETEKDFREDWTYLVGYWRTPGRPDLITVNGSNDLWFYPFEDGKLVDLKDDKQVGNDWKVTHFFDFYPI